MANLQVQVRDSCRACGGRGHVNNPRSPEAAPCPECGGTGTPPGAEPRWVSVESLLRSASRDLLKIVERAQSDRNARR